MNIATLQIIRAAFYAPREMQTAVNIIDREIERLRAQNRHRHETYVKPKLKPTRRRRGADGKFYQL